MENTEWTGNAILVLAGIVIPLVFAYFPWVKDWFEGLDSRWKPIANLGTLLLITVIRLLWSCQFDWTCIQAQLPAALTAFLAAIVANSATYTTAVRQFKKPENS